VSDAEKLSCQSVLPLSDIGHLVKGEHGRAERMPESKAQIWLASGGCFLSISPAAALAPSEWWQRLSHGDDHAAGRATQRRGLGGDCMVQLVCHVGFGNQSMVGGFV